MTDSEQLARWREATGREDPGEPVAVTLTVEVGNLRLRVNGEKCPKLNRRALMSNGKPRSHWHRRPVRGVAASSRPWL